MDISVEVMQFLQAAGYKYVQNVNICSNPMLEGKPEVLVNFLSDGQHKTCKISLKDLYSWHITGYGPNNGKEEI